MGWNSRWDKWVVESDLMAAGPEALEMQQQLKDKKKKAKVSQLHVVVVIKIGLYYCQRVGPCGRACAVEGGVVNLPS